ncbi:methyltransferase family protein [Eionea flava]
MKKVLLAKKYLPPLALVILIATAMKAMAWLTPWLSFPNMTTSIIAGLFFLFGSIPVINAIGLLIHTKTTVNPTSPQNTSTLVTYGIYRYSRNPMYLSFLLLLIGWSFWLSNIITLLGVVLVYWHLDRHQIPFEERALNKRFNESFKHYCQQTKRWL